MMAIDRFRAWWGRVSAISAFGNRVVITMLTNLGLAVLALITGLLAARSLGPTGRGELAAIQTWPTFLATVAVLGIPEALVYLSARESKSANRLLATALLITTITSIPFVIAGYFILPYVLRAQTPAIIQVARGYLWLIPIMASIGMMPNVLRGRNDLGYWNLLRCLPSVVWFLALVIGAVVFTPSPRMLAYGYLIGFSTLLLPYAWVINRRVPGPYNFSIGFIRPLLMYGLPLMLSIFPYTLNLRLDQMLMTGLFTPNILGFYAVAVAWSSAMTPLVSALPAVMLPQIAGTLDPRDQIRQLAQLVRIGSLFAVLICIFVMVITPLVLPLLFGADYRPAVFAAMILTLAGGIFGINALLESSAQSLGKPKFILIAELIGLAVTVLLLWLLLRQYQTVGAAIASLASYSTAFIVMIVLIIRSTNLHIRDLFIINQIDLQLIRNKILSLKSSF